MVNNNQEIDPQTPAYVSSEPQAQLQADPGRPEFLHRPDEHLADAQRGAPAEPSPSITRTAEELCADQDAQDHLRRWHQQKH